MKKRRGRRSFAWWSWLLFLVTIATTAAGYYFGTKEWKEAPKDYRATAMVIVNIRAPFVAGGPSSDNAGIADENQTKVMQRIESLAAMEDLVATLGLAEEWQLNVSEATQELRRSVDFTLDPAKRELFVIVTRNEPEEAARLANEIAAEIPAAVQAADEQTIVVLGREELAADIAPAQAAYDEALASLADALSDNGFPIDPERAMDRIYLTIPEVQEAHLVWEQAKENLEEVAGDQRKFERYLEQPLAPSLVMEKAEVPSFSIGPRPDGFRQQWMLLGLTAGLVGGLLLMLICWKLFP